MPAGKSDKTSKPAGRKLAKRTVAPGVQPYNAKMAELLKAQGKRKERPDV